MGICDIVGLVVVFGTGTDRGVSGGADSDVDIQVWSINSGEFWL